MTAGLRALRHIQVSNPEDSAGGAEAAQEIFLGILTPPADDRVFYTPQNEERNSLARNHANIVEVSKRADLVYTADVRFRYMTWLLAMGIVGSVSATQPDSTNEPNAYLWTFAPSLSAQNTPDTFTWEYGDNMESYESEYCFATRLEISGAPNAPCQVTCYITGRQRTQTSKTGAFTVVATQHAPFNLMKYFRDANWAALGSSQKTACLLGFTWSLDTMFTPRFTADGTLYFAALNEDAKAPELRLNLVRDTEMAALRTAHEGKTVVYPRITLFGHTELDSSQSNPPYMAIDGAYQIPTWPAWGDNEGIAAVEVTLQGCYDATGAKMMSIGLFNGLAAWPT